MNLEVIQERARGDAHATPIVFVHGMWHGAWCWAEHFMPCFAERGYTSYAVSLRGHCGSEGRDRLRWTKLADYVSDVAQVVAGLETAPVLVGHSMGGMIVQKYLETHSAPAGVLLVSAPPRGLLPATLRVVARHPWAFAKANLTLSMLPLVATPGLAQEAFFSAGMPPDQVQSYWSQLQDESYRAYLDMVALDLPHPRRVKTPLLVLGADGDRLFSPGEIEATARAYGTRAEMMAGLAHDAMLDAGWRQAAERMLGWLNEQGL